MINIKRLSDSEILKWVDFLSPPSNNIEYLNWNFIDVIKKAPIIGAFDDDIPIGSKPAWALKINFKDNSYNVLQYRHTEVHENYRRKGIFSRMTKLSVDESIKEDYDFIYNVSVPFSKMGYEKLGWKYYEGFHRLIKLHVSFHLFRKEKNINQFRIENHYGLIANISKKVNALFLDKFQLNKNKEYIKWRYSKPTKDYYCVADDNLGFITFSFEKYKSLTVLYLGEVSLIDANKKTFKKLFRIVQRNFEFHLVSILISKGHPYYNIFKKSLFFVGRKNLKFGIRLLKNNLPSDLFDLDNWAIMSADIDTF